LGPSWTKSTRYFRGHLFSLTFEAFGLGVLGEPEFHFSTPFPFPRPVTFTQPCPSAEQGVFLSGGATLRLTPLPTRLPGAVGSITSCPLVPSDFSCGAWGPSAAFLGDTPSFSPDHLGLVGLQASQMPVCAELLQLLSPFAQGPPYPSFWHPWMRALNQL
jgi:hypothetical protein